MYSDFEMIVKQFEDEITIIPLSDLHLGAKNCISKIKLLKGKDKKIEVTF